MAQSPEMEIIANFTALRWADLEKLWGEWKLHWQYPYYLCNYLTAIRKDSYSYSINPWYPQSSRTRYSKYALNQVSSAGPDKREILPEVYSVLYFTFVRSNCSKGLKLKWNLWDWRRHHLSDAPVKHRSPRQELILWDVREISWKVILEEKSLKPRLKYQANHTSLASEKALPDLAKWFWDSNFSVGKDIFVTSDTIP